MELADEAKSAFDQALVDSTIAALDALGPTVKESIFLLLQRRNSITLNEIPRLVGEFVKALQDVLGPTARRSEEHTSELQSRRDLVCRLLLEKKKRKCT